MNGEPEEENLNKSEISQVFEIALKRNLPVNFEVIYTVPFINNKRNRPIMLCEDLRYEWIPVFYPV